MDRFQGVIVHPQEWPEDLDYTGKRVVVIGSGSTASTLIPAIAQKAAHVTMLQRSPSYYLAPPITHELAVTLRQLDIPEEWTHEILRRQYMSQFNWLARTSLEAPDELHEFLIESMRPLLPEGFDIEKHFTPRYRPWQQRIAIVPEGDLFAALREGKASIVTDTIEEFTETGHPRQLRRGDRGRCRGHRHRLQPVGFGDVAFTVDGEPVDFSQRVTWRGIMITGVPNMAYVFGYFRHSWTLRVDLVSDLVCRSAGAHAGQRRHDGRPDAATRGRRHAATAVVGSGELQLRLRHALTAHHVQAGRPRAVDPHARARAGAGDPAEGRPR